MFRWVPFENLISSRAFFGDKGFAVIKMGLITGTFGDRIYFLW